MRTIVCGKPDELRLADTESPERQAGEALVRVKRIGICGTDMHAYKGNQPFFEYPRVLGHELSGIVEETGDNPEGLRPGDQVSVIPYLHCGTCVACRAGKTNCCVSMKVLGVHVDGGMRELISVPTSHLLRTNGLTLDQSAVLEPIGIGAHAVRRSGLGAGTNALVIGAGPIGLGVMAMARRAGANVIAMDMSEDRLRFSREWAGAVATVNVAADGPKDRLAELTGGEMPTVVFDATGNARSMNDSFQWVAHGGTLVFVGLVKADLTFNDPEFHKRELTLMGSRNATKEDFDAVRRAVESGDLDVERYVTHRSSFEDMIDQFEGWLKPESKVIKAMVEL